MNSISKEIDRVFSRLQHDISLRYAKEQISIALNNAIKKLGNVLVKDTRTALEATDINVSPAMSKGISIKNYKQFLITKVHIMRHPLLHLFESGTAERSYTTKNGVKHPTGRIRPHNFFNQAKVGFFGRFDSLFEVEMDKQLKKISKQ